MIEEGYTAPARGGGGGRPTKKTPKRCRAILDGIAAGWPYVVACRCAGVSYDVFKLWCRIDERFAQEVQLTEAQAIQANLDTIKAASRDNWPAAAWLLERRHPELFARPEVQLNVGIQNNMNAVRAASDGNSFEMLVVSDLEYLGLRAHPSYEHHPDVRDVDARVVPEELSGHLTRAGSPATSMILSQSEADAIEAQASRSREAVAKMFKQYRPREAGNGNGDRDATIAESVREKFSDYRAGG